MAKLILDDAANWQTLYSTTIFAEQGTLGHYLPIPKVVIPVLLRSHTCAIVVSSQSAKQTWHLGGYLSQKIKLGLTVGTTPETEASSKTLPLGEIVLLQFPHLTTNFSLSISPPKWFQDISIILWEYTGPEPEPIDDVLAFILARLSRIEAKLA